LIKNSARAKGVYDALDHCGNTSRSLVAWDGQLIHLGRIHPHLAGTSDHRGPRAPHSGTKPDLALAPMRPSGLGVRRFRVVESETTSGPTGSRSETNLI